MHFLAWLKRYFLASLEWLTRQLARPSFTDYVVAAFTVVLVGVSIYQGSVMRGQLAESQQEFTANHRPWMNIAENIKVIQPLTFNNEGATVTVQYSVKNGGTAPARYTNTVSKLSIGTAQSPQLDQQKAITFCGTGNVSLFIGLAQVGIPLILPGDVLGTTQITLTLAKENFEITNNTYGVRVYWFGCIAYSDEFGKPHGTAFVMEYVSDGKGVFPPTGVVQGTFMQTGIGTAY